MDRLFLKTTRNEYSVSSSPRDFCCTPISKNHSTRSVAVAENQLQKKKHSSAAWIGAILLMVLAVSVVVYLFSQPKPKGEWICGGSFVSNVDGQVHAICGYVNDPQHYYDCIVTQDSNGALHYTNCAEHSQPSSS